MKNAADCERPSDSKDATNATSDDVVTGVRKAPREPDAPTDEIEIEVADLSAAALDEPKPALAPRKTSLPPPPPPAALRVRLTTPLPPPAASPSLRPSLTPAAQSGKRDLASLSAEFDRLTKRMRERDTYLTEIEAVYAQRSEALLKAEAKLATQAAELDVRAARIRELELHVRTLLAESAPAPAGDDLTQIRGIGPHYARMLQALEVHSFAAIARWTPEDCVEFGRQLKVSPGRIERDQWVDQARALSGMPPLAPAAAPATTAASEAASP